MMSSTAPDNIPSKQFLLLALCMKQSPDYATVSKTVDLIREWMLIDPSFVLCVDEGGNTPLHLAARSNNSQVCLFLVEETNVRLDRRNADDLLAIHYALRHLNHVVFDALLRRSPARLLTHGEFGPRRETLLHTAAQCDTTRQASFVGMLVCAGADPLHRAASSSLSSSLLNDDVLLPDAYQLAKLRNPSPIAALMLNNYLVNRLMDEAHSVLRPEDVDDDLLKCRQEKRVAPADGYSATERRLIFANPGWWGEGSDAVLGLAAYIL